MQKPQFSQGQALCPAVQGALLLTFSLRGLGRLVVQSIRHAAARGTVGVCWCLKAEPRESDVCAEGTAAQEQVGSDSRPPAVILSPRKRLLPSRSAKVQREGEPYMGVPESQGSISPAAWALEHSRNRSMNLYRSLWRSQRSPALKKFVTFLGTSGKDEKNV